MWFGNFRVRVCATLIIGTVVHSAALVACAGDLNDEPLGYRLLFTQDRTTNFGPVAHPIASVNPGADDLMREPPFSFNRAAATSVELASLNGGGVSVVQGGGFYRPEKIGTFTAIYGRTDVNATTRQRADFGLSSNAGSLRYSHRLNDQWGLGGIIKLAQTKTALDDDLIKIKGAATVTEFTGGVLAAPAPQWSLGLMGTAGWVWSDSKLTTNGTKLTDETTAFLSRIRWGGGWRPLPSLGLYADWQYLHVQDKFGAADFGRMFLMAEYLLTPILPVKLSTIIDTAGKSTYSGGVGFYGMKNIKIDFAYSYDAFTEVRKEFGRSHYFVLILGAIF